MKQTFEKWHRPNKTCARDSGFKKVEDFKTIKTSIKSLIDY